MANTKEATASDTQTNEPGRWKIRSSFPIDNKRVLFSSVSEKRARKYIANRFPRGSEAYLESPDGSFESYEHERSDEYGVETDQWAEFDPTTWVPPSEQEPPGQSAWGDVES
jgi:hypothetical protein